MIGAAGWCNWWKVMGVFVNTHLEARLLIIQCQISQNVLQLVVHSFSHNTISSVCTTWSNCIGLYFFFVSLLTCLCYRPSCWGRMECSQTWKWPSRKTLCKCGLGRAQKETGATTDQTKNVQVSSTDSAFISCCVHLALRWVISEGNYSFIARALS